MSKVTTFAVVVPTGSIALDQFKTFEEACLRWNIPIALPITLDPRGNYIAAQGLSLREAQSIRQQISGLGYGVDVLSDALVTSTDSGGAVQDQATDTLIVDLPSVERNAAMRAEEPSEVLSAEWASLGSMQMENLDLGLPSTVSLASQTMQANPADISGGNWMNLADPGLSRTDLVNGDDEMGDMTKEFKTLKKASFSTEMQLMDSDAADDLLAAYGDDPMVELKDVFDNSQTEMPPINKSGQLHAGTEAHTSGSQVYLDPATHRDSSVSQAEAIAAATAAVTSVAPIVSAPSEQDDSTVAPSESAVVSSNDIQADTSGQIEKTADSLTEKSTNSDTPPADTSQSNGKIMQFVVIAVIVIILVLIISLLVT